MSIDSPLTSPTRSALKRSVVILSAAMVAAGLTLGGAVAADAAATPTATVNTNTATANGQVRLTLTNYLPNEPVTITLDSSPAQSYADPGYTQGVTDSSGSYSAAVYFPSSTTVGPHVLAVSSNGNAVTGTPSPFAITIVPQPTGSVTPSTVAVSAYQSKGVTVTFSGFAPGADVVFGVGDQGSGGPVGNGAPVTADATGKATITYVPTVGAHYSTAGTYYFSAFGSTGSYAAKPVTLTVTADPAAPTPAPAAPVATPAAPVKTNASFTG